MLVQVTLGGTDVVAIGASMLTHKKKIVPSWFMTLFKDLRNSLSVSSGRNKVKKVGVSQTCKAKLELLIVGKPLLLEIDVRHGQLDPVENMGSCSMREMLW